MNTRFAKETRHLQPSALFGGGVMLACVFLGESVQIPGLALAYWLACCLLAASAFAGHLGAGEMSLQLAHPISRDAIWREKLRVTIRSVAGIAVLFVFLTCLCVAHGAQRTWLPVAVGSLIAAPLFVVPLGFWIMLKVGEERAAVILSLLAVLLLGSLASGAALFMASFVPGQFSSPPLFTAAALVLFATVLSPGLFRRARACLLDWEDHQPLRQEYSVSIRKAGGSRCTGIGANYRTLILKELHLQQTNCLFIAGLLLCGAMIRFDGEPNLALVAMMSLVAFFSPMMLGAGAVCEEHRLGIHAQQNTQPAGIDRQWCTKFIVCFLISTSLGWGMVLGARELMPDVRGNTVNLMPIGVINGIAGEPFDEGSLLRYAIACAIGCIGGMCAGAMFRGYLRSVAVLLGSYFLLGWLVTQGAEVVAEAFWLNSVMYSRLVGFVCACLLAYLLFFTGKACFMAVDVSRARIIRQGALMVGVGIFGWLVAHATYLRSWELVIPAKEAGPPIINAEQVAGFLPQLMKGSAVDYKGRLWTAEFRRWSGDRVGFRIEDSNPVWKQVAGSHRLLLALQTNGTLWIRGSERWDQERWGLSPLYPHKFTQIDDSSDWESIADDQRARDGVFVAIKRDGSLWAWGRNVGGRFGLPNDAIVWDQPRKVGTRQDWKQVAIPNHGSNYALKKDGTLWRWGMRPATPEERHQTGSHYVYTQTPELVEVPFSGRIVRLRTTPGELMVLLDDDSAFVLNRDEQSALAYDASILKPMRAEYDDYETDGMAPREVDVEQFRWDTVYSDWQRGPGAVLTRDGTAIHQAFLSRKKFIRERIGEPGEWVSYGGTSWRQLLLRSDGTLWLARYSGTLYEDWYYDKGSLIPPRWRPKQIGRLFPEPEVDWPR